MANTVSEYGSWTVSVSKSQTSCCNKKTLRTEVQWMRKDPSEGSLCELVRNNEMIWTSSAWSRSVSVACNGLLGSKFQYFATSVWKRWFTPGTKMKKISENFWLIQKNFSATKSYTFTKTDVHVLFWPDQDAAVKWYESHFFLSQHVTTFTSSKSLLVKIKTDFLKLLVQLFVRWQQYMR